jgi:hypothetical protein
VSFPFFGAIVRKPDCEPIPQKTWVSRIAVIKLERYELTCPPKIGPDEM